MSTISVVIEDQIREVQVPLNIHIANTANSLVKWYVEQYGLPQRDFKLKRIEYWLVRALDGIYLTSQATFHQSGITEGEVLQLVSPEGRRVQNLVRRLLDEIEAELRDQATGEIRDTLTDEAWERVTKKLDEIEKTVSTSPTS